ncbi:MAG: CoA-binding protein [Chitinophagaceae bacterium]|nr:CoA-binding protein [Chitinophagaceae bacterium]MCW5927517.1 CoA-binding protein [Chitinophagaceae bacterium]
MNDKENTGKTLVLGASDNPERYSYLAINRLRAAGHPVIAIGKKTSKVADVEIITEQQPAAGIGTVTLYLNAGNQKAYYDYILSLRPKRIIFNPGAENPELEEIAAKNGIRTMQACTLVLLSTGQF